MKPQRPDSAKSAKTRVTIDSQFSSNQLNNSKFSQTYSTGVKLNSDKNNDFHKYVAEKNKDPKFKKFLQTNLPQIPEKQQKNSTELSKLTSKPFQRKTSKIDKQKSEKKVEEEPHKKQEQQSKDVKKQNLQSSKTFIDKSKQKLKISSKQDIDENHYISKKQQRKQGAEGEHKQNGNGTKAKINFNGFTLNIPGKTPQVIKQKKQEQKCQKKQKMPLEAKQMLQKWENNKRNRENLMTELSQYVKQVEQSNIDYLPKRYDQFIERNMENVDINLQKINIQDLMEEPNQRDYQNLMRKINQNEQRLTSNERQGTSGRNSSLSINLEEVIDGSDSQKQQSSQQKADDSSVIMSSMTASDIKDRNMFLTQILKGRRLTQQDISQIKQNQNTMAKLIKLEGVNKQEQLDDDKVEIVQINMNKKKSTKIMERNKIEAAGDYFRQCDYLRPEQLQRIDDIINGVKIQSPFQMTQMQSLVNRRIDQGIKLHRQLCRSLQGNSQQTQTSINQQMLPKDPILRKNAQMKILKQKITSVNQRLSSLNSITINKQKIKNLVNKLKQGIKPSKMSESLINQKKKQIQQQCLKLTEAQSILTQIQRQKQDILSTLQDLTSKFQTMEADVIKLQKMDAEERRKMEQEQLQAKKNKIKQVQIEAQSFIESDLQNWANQLQDLKQKMEILDQIICVKNQELTCEGYKQDETIEQIDQLITKKWKATEEAVRIIRQQA